MNMKKRTSIWSRALAMLCALVLCISMVPAASAVPPATPSNVTSVTMTSTGIQEFWTYNNSLQITVDSPQTDSGARYSLSGSTLTIAPDSGSYLPRSVTFWAVAQHEPAITGDKEVNVSVVDSGNSWWLITLAFTTAASDAVTLTAEAVSTYTITFPEQAPDDTYTLYKNTTENTVTVKQGETYTFSVIPKDGYDAPKVSASTGCSLTRDGVNGVNYTVSNITSNVIITITDGDAIQPKVTFTSGDGYKFVTEGNADISTPMTVGYGDDVSFMVSLFPGYTQSENTVKVYANGTEVSKNESGVYTIDDITVDQTVSVTGVQLNTYKVTLPQNPVGYYITTMDPTTVGAGGSFAFDVVVNPGYDDDSMVVKANGTVLTKSNGSYTISNIAADTTITIEGVTEAQYAVTVAADNATVKVGEQALTTGVTVPHGNLTFTVMPAPGYKVDSVRVNGATVLPSEDGEYTIFVNGTVSIGVVESPLVDVTLTTTITASGDKTYTIVVKTTPGEVSGNNNDISVVGYGTLYSNQSFSSRELEDQVMGIQLDNTLKETLLAQGSAKIYSYSQSVNFDLDELTNTFSYTFNNSSSTDRYGAGWIKLSDGKDSWIVFSDTVGPAGNP
mgnify:CR=1 FL=1